MAEEIVPVEFHFRVGIHFGDVYRFWDDRGARQGFWNYVGEGINGGNRVLAAIGKEKDDVVYLSGSVRRAIYHDSAQLADDALVSDAQIIYGRMENRGRHKDKHGRPWRVFQINHARLHSLDLVEH